jgi:hypothetical protein
MMPDCWLSVGTALLVVKMRFFAGSAVDDRRSDFMQGFDGQCGIWERPDGRVVGFTTIMVVFEISRQSSSSFHFL